MDWKAHQRWKPKIQRPRHNPMTSGPGEQPTQRKGRSVGPVGWSADHPGRPTDPWAPPPSGSMWLSPIGLLCRFKEEYARFPAEERVAPPYIYDEGRGSILNHGGDGRSPSSLQATLEIPSRCSSSSLVEVLGLEDFRYES